MLTPLFTSAVLHPRPAKFPILSFSHLKSLFT
jgi:hypothetical protein